MKCGHLFNGISGFGLAAHWMGWENVMHCEIDPFCNRVMNHHFPNSIQHEDIRTTDFTIYRGELDLLTGGFPCQPYSAAGKRKGKEDERHLWPEMLRAIREIQPGWIVGENVRGLTNWNGGMVFDEVQADLEAEGYEVLPFLLPACGVNAPHRRDRIWFIAINSKFAANGGNNTGTSSRKELDLEERCVLSSRREQGTNNTQSSTIDAANPNSHQRCEGWMHEERSGETTGHTCSCNSRDGRTTWEDFPTQSPLCSRNDGIPSGLVPVTISGRRGRRTLNPKQSMGYIRNKSIKAAGNAIVPEVAYQIFKAIEAYAQPPLTPNP